jgi:hypothetical protein
MTNATSPVHGERTGRRGSGQQCAQVASERGDLRAEQAVSSHVHSVTDEHSSGPRSSLGPVSIVLPGAPEYDDLRRPWAARFREARPAAIARCATPGDARSPLKQSATADGVAGSTTIEWL